MMPFLLSAGCPWQPPSPPPAPRCCRGRRHRKADSSEKSGRPSQGSRQAGRGRGTPQPPAPRYTFPATPVPPVSAWRVVRSAVAHGLRGPIGSVLGRSSNSGGGWACAFLAWVRTSGNGASGFPVTGDAGPGRAGPGRSAGMADEGAVTVCVRVRPLIAR